MIAFALASALCACRSTSARGASRWLGERGATPEKAQAAVRAGDHERAAALWYELFLRGGDGADQACAEAARAMCRFRDYESARGVVEQGLALHPAHPELLELDGNLLIQLGFSRAAETRFERALEVEPGRPSALLALGRLRVEIGMERAAIAPLKQRLEAGHDDADTWILLARALRAVGETDPAFEAYAQAFARGAADPTALVCAASLYIDERAKRRDPHSQDLAADWLTAAVDADPQCTPAHFYLGVVAEDRGEEERAIESYRRAIETDANFLPALTHLAEIHARRGERDAAAPIVARALAIERDPARREALKSLLADREAPPPPPPVAGEPSGGG
jgi:tetratricopeptide (TPR) repeat protein